MLKVKRRKDIKSDIYYVTGTFYYEGESRYINKISCKTKDKKEANAKANQKVKKSERTVF